MPYGRVVSKLKFVGVLDMKKTKRITLILYGLCAIVWTLRVIFGIVYKEYDYDSVFFILDVLTALIWIAAFIRWTIKYRSEKGERRKNV